MAYQDDLELQNQAKASPGGILAGSGGAASGQAAQPVGSGFTNLQTYLSANKGQGAGVAQDMVSEGQKGVDKARAYADSETDKWAATGVQNATQAGQDGAGVYQAGINEIQADPNNTEGAYASARGTQYGGPANAQGVEGYNALEANYQNVKKTADNFAGDYNTQKAGLQNKFGYSSGFGALDTFLGRQDGKSTIQNWQNGVQTGSAQGGIDKVNAAIAGGQKAVSDAQAAHTQAGRDAKTARSAGTSTKVGPPSAGGFATPVDAPYTTQQDYLPDGVTPRAKNQTQTRRT